MQVFEISWVGGQLHEKELKEARRIAFSELEEKAFQLGANAIIGIDVDYETIGDTGSMLMVSVTVQRCSFKGKFSPYYLLRYTTIEL